MRYEKKEKGFLIGAVKSPILTVRIGKRTFAGLLTASTGWIPRRLRRGRAFRLLLIVPLFIILHACSHKMDEAAKSEDDPCANAVGNGNEIIPGPAGPEGGDTDQVFRSLEVDPSNPDVVYMGTERNGIVKTSDGGDTWNRLRQGMRHSAVGYPEVWDIAVSPFDPSLVIAATADSPGPVAGDYPSGDACVYRSTDGGATWSRSNCRLTNSYALAVRFDPQDPAVVMLGVGAGKATFSSLLGQPFDGALMRSDDAGLNWNSTTTPSGADKNVFWVLRAYGSGTAGFVTFGLCMDKPSKNLGFLRSEDGGLNWSPFAPLLRTRLITAFDVSTDGLILYAVERDAFSVLKSTDGGSSWNTLAVPANGPVKISPSNHDILLFCEGEKAYRSANGLQSRELVLTAMGRVDDIEFTPSKPSMVYLATEGYHIYKSTNSGVSWSHLIDLRTAGVLN
jgi:photosystem II stability/assembly factor-like uncharacterized protein